MESNGNSENSGKRLFEAAIVSEGGLRIDATFRADSTIDAIRHIQDAFVFSCGPLTARHTCTVRPARDYRFAEQANAAAFQNALGAAK